LFVNFLTSGFRRAAAMGTLQWSGPRLVQRMERFEVQLPPTARSPHIAREWVRASLETLGDSSVAPHTELLVSELVANVVRHVCEPMQVRLIRQDETVRVEVDDPSALLPVIRHPDIAVDHGRGLLLVAALAARWGTNQHPDDGKTVWFELEAP
jgi:anti-sigma regulatory factor (Ser/Thr protein kinase)